MTFLEDRLAPILPDTASWYNLDRSTMRLAFSRRWKIEIVTMGKVHVAATIENLDERIDFFSPLVPERGAPR